MAPHPPSRLAWTQRHGGLRIQVQSARPFQAAATVTLFNVPLARA